MPSTCIKRKHRRGTAEIETLLVILFVVLPILFVIVFAGNLGLTRLVSVFSAENNAYNQSVNGATIASVDPAPVTASGQPDLLTRFAYADQVQRVNQSQGGRSATLAPVTVEDKAWFLDSSWHFPASGDDQPAIQTWFTNYVDQSHSASLDYALGISPPGPP